MHNFIKPILLFSLCVIVSGCSAGKTYTKDNIIHESDKFYINAETITLKNDAGAQLVSDISSDTDFWIEDFKTRVSDNMLKPNELPNLNIRHKVYTDNSSIISLVTEKYLYINGVHGNTWWKARNFNYKNNCYLSLPDLFYDDSYINMLNTIMEEMTKSDPEQYHDLWEQPTVKKENTQNFYIDGKTLVIFFQPYELSYYAKGVVKFPIEATELRGYLKEEYLKMMN